MGCVACRRANREETCIDEASDSIGFGSINFQEVDAAIRKYSSDNSVNQFQFNALAKHLSLTLNPQTNNLFARLKDTDGNFNRTSLIVLGMMLSVGRSNEKAKALFEAFDMEHSGEISLEDFDCLLNIMCMISADLLPELVLNDTEVQAYATTCRRSIPEATTELKKAFIEANTMKKAHFIKVFSQHQGGRLVHANGFRSYLYSFNKRSSSVKQKA